MKKMKPIKRIACAALLLLLCAAGTQALAAAYGDAILREGMRTQEVRRMQEDLAELGYYKGSVTGHYGNLTKEAVRRFQRKNGLTVDGIAGPLTLGRLAELTGQTAWAPGWDAGVSGGQTSGGVTGGGSSDGTLRLDDRGDAVQRLQENLNLLGYYDGTITGHYGRLTKEAVRLFQRDNDLTSDGIAGPKTLKKIEEFVAGEIRDGEKDGAAGKDEQQGEKKEETAEGRLDPSVTLRYGSRSQHVSALQDALRELGFFNRDTTGYYGLNTAQAVEDYQRERGLTADGIAGRATLTMLNKELAGGTVTDGKKDEDTTGKDAQQGDKKEEAAGGELDVTVKLRYGNRSEHVSALQDALRALGYFNRDTTGYYGLNTTWAVEAYQRAKGLTADGIAGRATLTAINKDLAAAKEATAAPASTVSTFASVNLGNAID